MNPIKRSLIKVGMLFFALFLAFLFGRVTAPSPKIEAATAAAMLRAVAAGLEATAAHSP